MVRRTAEIFLCDADDWESILAKYGIYGIWDESNHNQICDKLYSLGVERWAYKLADMECCNPDIRKLPHRTMSNNSIAFESKPSEEMLELIFTIMQGMGEPGFFNMEEAGRRRPNAKGTNPCGEIILDSKGVCNLTTVNVMAFVKPDEEEGYEIDFSALCEAQALSARAGMRMTCLDLELPEWNFVHQRDRLIGTSLTGWKDAMAMCEYTEDQENQLLNILANVVSMEAVKYAQVLRIPTPLLDTTVKPEGTLSQRAGGVSSGLHVSHAPFYIRRIRINADDALVKVAEELGWTVQPDGDKKNTMVIDFPVKSGAKKTRGDQNVDDQFDNYYNFQAHYTSHNSSNTISVRPDEWQQALKRVYQNWNEFVGVSFLAYDGGEYPLAPYEEITEEEYEKLKAAMKPFDPTLLRKYESEGIAELDEEPDADCSTGACPIR